MPRRRILAEWVAGALLAAASCGRAPAQGPDGPPPPPPDRFSKPSGPGPTTPASGGCTPGHCAHRTPLARLRCKRHLQEAFLGFPEEFERPPLGARVKQANLPQIRNADVVGMVLRQYDFAPGSTTLNFRGRDRLAKIAASLPRSFDPVIVERTPEAPGLDLRRRDAVLAALAGGPFPIPPQRVLVGPDPGLGQSGLESAIIQGGMLQRAALGGPPVGGVNSQSLNTIR